MRALIGREPEQAAIGALLDRADQAGGALVVRGTPGVGKSALLEWAAATAGDRFRILRAVGTVTEFGLPYAALHQVLHVVLGHRSGLTGHHPATLDVAFGRNAGEPPDLYTVAMAALELLAEVAPVLVLADDAQWMDPASQQVLAFVARRLTADRVVLLATHRENEQGALLDAAIPSLSLAPLDSRAAEQLLDRVGDALDPAVRALLLDVARGNPLALLELPRAAEEYSGANLDQLPLTARLENSFLARTGEFGPGTTTILEVAALSDAADIGEIVAAAELLSLPDTPLSLDPAVSAGLIAVDGTAVRFRHPLIRSAILQRLGHDRQRACHAALSRVLRDQPERSVWHAAAAAVRPDAVLADALERHAGQATARGAPTNALRALERAAQLSVDRPQRADRTYRAAVLAYAAGLPESGDWLRSRYRNLVAGDADGLRYEWLNELAGGDRGGEQRIHQLVSLAERAIAGGDRELGADFLRSAALRCWNLLPGRPIGKQVVAAAQRLGVDDALTRAALLAYGSPFDSDGPIRALIARETTRDTATTYQLAHAAACAGAFDVSEGLLGEAAERLRWEGHLHTLGRTLSLLSWSVLRRGNWSYSVAAAEEGARLCAETRQPFWEAAALVAHAAVAAFRGDFEAAEELVERADRVDSRRFATVDAVILLARAAVLAGRGSPEQAFACLAQPHDPSGAAYHPAHALWSLASLAEAAVAGGQADAAHALIDQLPDDVRATTSPTGRMNLTFARAVLAPDDEVESRFAEALSMDLTRWPYEHCRLLFAYGKILRRRRRVRESRDYLRRARDGFDRLGARPLAERARDELRAAGERSESQVADVWDVLSPQEVQIAAMVARGLSNRDIAKGLFISHRTVGTHLYRMFPKLGITSRAELQRMAAEHQL